MRQVTEREYWQVYGLLVAARLLEERVNSLRDAAHDVLTANERNHFDDAVWGHPDMDPRQVMERIGLEIE